MDTSESDVKKPIRNSNPIDRCGRLSLYLEEGGSRSLSWGKWLASPASTGQMGFNLSEKSSLTSTLKSMLSGCLGFNGGDIDTKENIFS